MVTAWGGAPAQNALAQVRARGLALGESCYICGQGIDYTLPGTDPMGCTVQHIKARSTHPELTWDPANWAPSHRHCNSSAGAREILSMGLRSRDW